MDDDSKTREQLVAELAEARKQLARTEAERTRDGAGGFSFLASEKQYASLLNSMEDIIHVVDRDFRIVLINDAGRKWVKKFVSPPDAIGRSVFEIFPFLPEQIEEEYKQVFATGETMFTEERNSIDGVTRITEARKIPILEADEVTQVLTMVRDITERKEAEEALRESERRYRLVAENASDYIWCRDLDLNATFVSPSVVRLRGFTPEEAAAQSLSEIMPPEYLAQVIRAIQEQVALEDDPDADPHRSVTVEQPLKRKDGTYVWTESKVTFVRDESNQPVGILGVTRDIQERKLAEQALRDSEQRYRLLAENVQDVIFIRDLNLEATYVSPSVERQRGYTPEEVTKMSLEEVLTPESFDRARQRLIKALEKEQHSGSDSEQVETLELEEKCKDGSTIWTETKLSFLRDDEGKPTGILGVSRDITAQKRSQEEQEKLRSQLYQADKMTTVGQLAAGVAHEINNPVGFVLPNLLAIREQTEIVQELLHLYESGAPRKQIEQYKRETGVDGFLEEIGLILDDCLEGIRRVKETTRELRQFSRVDDEGAEKVQVSELLDSSLLIANNEIKYKAKVIREYSPVPAILANRGKLSQVFLNIVVNAAHAIEEGHADDNWIRAGIHLEGDQVLVEIANSGTVIPPEVQSRIFDPFFTTKPRSQGTGLGLSISYSIVQQHGGHIEVESETGTGTVFRVRLPLESDLAPTETEATPGSTRSARKLRILVIDDEESLLRSFKRVFRDHEVSTAQGGQEALELLQDDQAFDIVLCDLMMPRTAGMDVHEWVESRYPVLADKFVFLTGGAFTERAREFASRLRDRVFMKPLGPEELQDIVNRMIDPE